MLHNTCCQDKSSSHQEFNMASVKVMIPIVMAIICMLNPGADAKLCNGARTDIHTFLNEWWIVAFASRNYNARLVCGHFSFVRESNDLYDPRFNGYWSSKTGSSTIDRADLAGELTEDGANIRGFKLLPEWVVSIEMCNDDREMVWRRAQPPGNFLLSRSRTASPEVLAEFEAIAAGDDLPSVKEADNSYCDDVLPEPHPR